MWDMSAAALEQTARLAGPGATVRAVRALAGGTGARTSLIQTANPQLEMVLREFPPGDDAAGREARVLRALNGLGGLAPRLLASDVAETAAGGSWLLISRLPGAADITPRQPAAHAEQLGRVLARIHQTPVDGLAEPPGRQAVRAPDPLRWDLWAVARSMRGARRGCRTTATLTGLT